MGKWTMGYYDDVLSSKIKSLVSGAIKRSKLEKTEPDINFERFVQDLDAGDSFTTSLFDILVKELADRQSRSNEDDRRLIGERTAKSLRTITSSNRVYFSTSFPHRTSGRSRSHLPTYFTAPPEEIDLDDDDDEFHALLDPNIQRQHDVTMETTGVVPSFATRSSSPAPISSAEELPTFARTWGPPRSYLNPGTSLSRASSLRRPTRSRTVDFNDFTSRRRSTIRNNPDSSSVNGSATTDATTASDTHDRDRAQWGTTASDARDRDRAPWGTTSSDARDRDRAPWGPTGTTRRFFGFSRLRRTNPELNLWGELPEGEDELVSSSNPTSSYLPASTPFQGAVLPSPPEIDERNVDTGTTSTPALHSNHGHRRIPRLHRNGLRQPESVSPRHSSPAETVVLPDDSSRRAPSPPEISEYVVESFDSPRFGHGAFTSLPIRIQGDDFGETEVGATYGTVDTAAYPTPGSTVDN